MSDLYSVHSQDDSVIRYFSRSSCVKVRLESDFDDPFRRVWVIEWPSPVITFLKEGREASAAQGLWVKTNNVGWGAKTGECFEPSRPWRKHSADLQHCVELVPSFSIPKHGWRARACSGNRYILCYFAGSWSKYLYIQHYRQFSWTHKSSLLSIAHTGSCMYGEKKRYTTCADKRQMESIATVCM